ncbi:HAD family hydrolase [Bacillus sp. Bva_UNVM-123]
MVRDFHKAFNHPYNETPTPMDKKTALNRTVWTAEELVELLYATVGGNKVEFLKLTDSLLDGIGAAINKMVEEAKPVEDILVAQADALTDVEYFNQGSFTILGVKPFNLFKIVQEANMGKLHNGIPKFRKSDGKIIKPENWERDFAPEKRLKEEIERQKKDKVIVVRDGNGNRVTMEFPQ